MEYVTSIEQLGIERGLAKGLERECKLLTKMLCYRFPTLHAPTIEEQLKSLSMEKRSELAEQIFKFTSLGEVHEWLQQSMQQVL